MFVAWKGLAIPDSLILLFASFNYLIITIVIEGEKIFFGGQKLI